LKEKENERMPERILEKSRRDFWKIEEKRPSPVEEKKKAISLLRTALRMAERRVNLILEKVPTDQENRIKSDILIMIFGLIRNLDHQKNLKRLSPGDKSCLIRIAQEFYRNEEISDTAIQAIQKIAKNHELLQSLGVLSALNRLEINRKKRV
jgi:hypothetical protein